MAQDKWKIFDWNHWMRSKFLFLNMKTHRIQSRNKRSKSTSTQIITVKETSFKDSKSQIEFKHASFVYELSSVSMCRKTFVCHFIHTTKLRRLFQLLVEFSCKIQKCKQLQNPQLTVPYNRYCAMSNDIIQWYC